jgi:hypothetical protein
MKPWLKTRDTGNYLGNHLGENKAKQKKKPNNQDRSARQIENQPSIHHSLSNYLLLASNANH